MKFPNRSTAAKTKMLTVCKRCNQPNGNGYRYCTECHKDHKCGVQTGRPQTVQSMPASDPVVDDEVLRACGIEL